MKPPQKLALIEESLTKSIIGAFYTVYRELGYGFLESIYSAAMERELIKHGHRVSREVLVQVHYMGELVGYQRLDMLVDDRVVVENKAGERLSPMARDQLYAYLRGTDLEVGLLFHFGPEARFQRSVHSKSLKRERS